MSAQVVNKDKHSNKILVALFGHDQGTSQLYHGLSMVYVICTSLGVNVLPRATPLEVHLHPRMYKSHTP